MKCTNCGKNIVDGAKFCHECGTPVPPKKTYTQCAPKTENTEKKLSSKLPVNDKGQFVYDLLTADKFEICISKNLSENIPASANLG